MLSSLYADISDDSFQQKIIEGDLCSMHLVSCILSNMTPSGFHALTWVGSLPSADFHQLFHVSSDSKIEDQLSLREGYKTNEENYRVIFFIWSTPELSAGKWLI